METISNDSGNTSDDSWDIKFLSKFNEKPKTTLFQPAFFNKKNCGLSATLFLENGVRKLHLLDKYSDKANLTDILQPRFENFGKLLNFDINWQIIVSKICVKFGVGKRFIYGY